jgi:hypothetical protein
MLSRHCGQQQYNEENFDHNHECCHQHAGDEAVLLDPLNPLLILQANSRAWLCLSMASY